MRLVTSWRLSAVGLILVGFAFITMAVAGTVPRIMIIVEDGIYPEISASCSILMDDLTREGYDPVLWVASGSVTPSAIKDSLGHHWQTAGLRAAVLVGEVPAAYTVVCTGNFSDPDNQIWYLSLDACDHYYGDLTGDWDVIENVDDFLCAGAPPYVSECHEYSSCATFRDEFLVTFADWSSRPQYEQEICVTRIMAHNLAVAGEDEASIINKYLAWNHSMRTRRREIPSIACLCDAINDPVIDHNMDFSGIFSQETRDAHCPEAQYYNRLCAARGSRLIYILAHSNYAGHSMYDSWLSVTELLSVPRNGVFYILNACSACRWDQYISEPEYPNYLGGVYVFAKNHDPGDYGLCAIGFTGVGGFNNLYHMTNYMRAFPDDNYGNAYTYWFNNNLMINFQPHNYVYLGDPTITPKMGDRGWLAEAFKVSDPGVTRPPSALSRIEDATPCLDVVGGSIRFSVPGPSRATVDLYDVQGRLVARLFDKPDADGLYSIRWDGLSLSGGKAASGIYFCRLTAGSEIANRKIVIAR